MKELIDKIRAEYIGAAILVVIGAIDLFHAHTLGQTTDLTFIIIGVGGFGLDLKAAIPPKL